MDLFSMYIKYLPKKTTGDVWNLSWGYQQRHRR